MEIQKEIRMQANYYVHIWTDEAYAKMLEKTQKMPRIWFLDKNGILTKKARQLVTEMTRQLGWNMHNIRSRSWHNIVPSVVRDALASRIAWNVVTPTFEANYIALGTGNAPTTNDNTQLDDEYIRGVFTDRFSVANTAFLDKFFSSAEIAGETYLEIGVFVDGTASADTWFLLSRILIDEAITTGENMTINTTFTII